MTPRIDSYSFGRIVIGGKTYTSDVIIYPDRVDGSWWRREGHNLYVEDLKDVVSAKPEVLVVGTGAVGAMRIPSETREYLRSKEIELMADKTGKACKTYNQISGSKKVVAALHLTC